MHRQHTDSSVIVHHEDGSWTETTEITHFPATRGQKATAWAALVGLCVAPFAPLAAVIAMDRWEDRKQRRAAEKAESEKK